MKELSEKTMLTEELEDFSVMNFDSYGNKFWRNKAGCLHREDGPAFIASDGKSLKSWWKNGKRHREDGPAIEEWYSKEFWLNGKRVSEEEVRRLGKIK